MITRFASHLILNLHLYLSLNLYLKKGPEPYFEISLYKIAQT